jgi:hypothetical protein
MSRALRDAALAYADRGWHVHPLQDGAKQPVTRNGKNDATSDLATVLNWWQAGAKVQSYNIGINCHESGLVVLDIDPRNGGSETLAWASNRLGKLPATVTAITGGDGLHYYFKHPGVTLRGKAGNGIDVKDYGYVLAPPSLHPSGEHYIWAVGKGPDDIELATLPDLWLKNLTVPDLAPRQRAEPGMHNDPLRRIPATVYVEKLTGNEDVGGFVTCPFHGGGNERTPSLKCTGDLWACYACEAPIGKQCMGGNIYDFAALLWDVPAPPRGVDFQQVYDRLAAIFLDFEGVHDPDAT